MTAEVDTPCCTKGPIPQIRCGPSTRHAFGAISHPREIGYVRSAVDEAFEDGTKPFLWIVEDTWKSFAGRIVARSSQEESRRC